MSARRVVLAAWKCVVLHTPAGPVRLRLTSDDPNDYADLDLEAPPGMRLEVVALPMGERPERITRKVGRAPASGGEWPGRTQDRRPEGGVFSTQKGPASKPDPP